MKVRITSEQRVAVGVKTKTRDAELTEGPVFDILKMPGVTTLTVRHESGTRLIYRKAP